MDVNLSKLQETVADRGAWHAAAHGVKSVGHDLATGQEKQQGCLRNLSLTPPYSATLHQQDHQGTHAACQV